jgi:perosamine synthetase
MKDESGARIALSGVDIGRAERRAVMDVLNSKRLALGPRIVEFERSLAKYVGVRHAVAVSSGTAGLHLVVRALKLGAGDEVVTTPFSFIASANCILFERARPVFADIDPDTLNIDPAEVEKRITRRTKAILAVDVFGHPANWPELERIARRRGLALIEDSCEALGAGVHFRASGATPRAGTGPLRKCGTFGDAAVFAFYPNKQITTGEGGMVVTDDRRIADACRSMANQGRRIRGGAWLEHVRLGYNYRTSELNAAMGVAQLSRIERLLARRERVARLYSRLLAEVPQIRTPYEVPDVRMSWFVYVVRLTEDYTRKGRDRVLEWLRARGIECSDYFRPIHLQPFYRGELGTRRGDFPVAESVGDRVIALPFHGLLTRQQVERVVGTLKKVLSGQGPHSPSITTGRLRAARAA